MIVVTNLAVICVTDVVSFKLKIFYPYVFKYKSFNLIVRNAIRELELLKAAKEGNNNMVKQLLQDTYVDPRENLYNHPVELKEFWFGTPLMLAGKFSNCWAIF